MLEDSQRVNTDLKARACEEKSVVILNTCCLHVNTIAELVFDMMLHTELEVTGRSIDSILNMITDASQGDTAHIMVAAVMSPRAKGYDSSDRRRGGNLMKTATRRFREDQPRSQPVVETTASAGCPAQPMQDATHSTTLKLVRSSQQEPVRQRFDNTRRPDPTISPKIITDLTRYRPIVLELI